MKKYCFFLILLVIVSSCDCGYFIQGKIIDYDTNLPVDKVKIYDLKRSEYLVADSDYIFTDSLGKFNFQTMSIGLFGCSGVQLSFERDGYATIIRKYKSCCSYNQLLIMKKK